MVICHSHFALYHAMTCGEKNKETLQLTSWGKYGPRGPCPSPQIQVDFFVSHQLALSHLNNWPTRWLTTDATCVGVFVHNQQRTSSNSINKQISDRMAF